LKAALHKKEDLQTIAVFSGLPISSNLKLLEYLLSSAGSTGTMFELKWKQDGLKKKIPESIKVGINRR